MTPAMVIIHIAPRDSAFYKLFTSLSEGWAVLTLLLVAKHHQMNLSFVVVSPHWCQGTRSVMLSSTIIWDTHKSPKVFSYTFQSTSWPGLINSVSSDCGLTSELIQIFLLLLHPPFSHLLMNLLLILQPAWANPDMKLLGALYRMSVSSPRVPSKMFRQTISLRMFYALFSFICHCLNSDQSISSQHCWFVLLDPFAISECNLSFLLYIYFFSLT